MPSPVRLTGSVINNIPVWDSPAAKDRAIRALDGQRFECTLQKERKRKSTKQRGYYWACIVAMIADAAGYTQEEAHEALRWELLKVYHDDSPLPTVRSTEDLDTVETEEYHEKCRILGAQVYGLAIPDPDGNYSRPKI